MQTTIDYIKTTGELVLLFVNTLSWIFRGKIRWKIVLQQMGILGYDSLPIIMLTSVFIGMIFVLQTGYQLGKFGATLYAGGIAGIALARELAPVFTAFAIAARCGGSLAAEIGSMQITEQIDALKTLATDPVKYLVVPRFLASVFVLPLLTVISFSIGILGGLVAAVLSLNLSAEAYLLTTKDFLIPKEIYSGLIKTIFFGAIIGIVGCYHGFQTTGGAEGVGKATRNAVVSTVVIVILADYVLTSLILALWA